MVFVKNIELLECFICMLDTPTSSEYAENVKVNVLTSCWDNSQKIQQNTKGHPQIFGTGWNKVPYFNGLIYKCIDKNQLN